MTADRCGECNSLLPVFRLCDGTLVRARGGIIDIPCSECADLESVMGQDCLWRCDNGQLYLDLCKEHSRHTLGTQTFPETTPIVISQFDSATLATTVIGAELCTPPRTNTTDCDQRCTIFTYVGEAAVRFKFQDDAILVAGYEFTVNINGVAVNTQYRRSIQTANPIPKLEVGSPVVIHYGVNLAPGDTLEICMRPYAFYSNTGTPEELFLQFFGPVVTVECETLVPC